MTDQIIDLKEVMKNKRGKRLVVWTLGNAEQQIYPTAKAIDTFKTKLLECLEAEGDQHLVWGPDLSFSYVDLEDGDLSTLKVETPSE